MPPVLHFRVEEVDVLQLKKATFDMEVQAQKAIAELAYSLQVQLFPPDWGYECIFT